MKQNLTHYTKFLLIFLFLILIVYATITRADSNSNNPIEELPSSHSVTKRESHLIDDESQSEQTSDEESDEQVIAEENLPYDRQAVNFSLKTVLEEYQAIAESDSTYYYYDFIQTITVEPNGKDLTIVLNDPFKQLHKKKKRKVLETANQFAKRHIYLQGYQSDDLKITAYDKKGKKLAQSRPKSIREYDLFK